MKNSYFSKMFITGLMIFLSSMSLTAKVEECINAGFPCKLTNTGDKTGVHSYCVNANADCKMKNYEVAICVICGKGNCVFDNVDYYRCVNSGKCTCTGGKCLRFKGNDDREKTFKALCKKK